MKKKLIFFVIFTLLLISITNAQKNAQNYYPINKIKEGMILNGKTTLKGNELSEFKIKISGIIENIYPGKSYIIGEILGDYYKDIGVLSGMSGSPVYYENKIVGAVAFSFTFAKKPVAGITPFKDMLETEKSFSSEINISISLKSSDFKERIIDKLKKILNSKSLNNSLFTYKIPFHASGFTCSMIDKICNDFSGFNLKAVPSGSNQIKIPSSLDIPEVELVDGDPINVHLAIGDFDISASGTVTHVKGEDFYAFGHPFLNIGKIEYPVSKAKIIDVVPSYENSFRLSNSLKYVGKITEDRNSGLKGKLSSFPDLVPLNVQINYSKPKEFKVKMVRNNLLTPILVANILQNIVLSELKSAGDLSLKVSGNIYLKNGKSVSYDDIFSGSSSSSDLSIMYASLAYILIDNPVKNFEIEKIDVSITPYEKKKMATLVKVIAEKYSVKPGEKIPITLYYKTDSNRIINKNLFIPIPPLPKGENIYMLIGDAQTIQNFEIKQYTQRAGFPNTGASLLRALNNLRKNNIIYFKILSKNRSIIQAGHEYSGLPDSFFPLINQPIKDIDILHTNISDYKDYALPINYKFQGKSLLKFEIK